MNISVRIFKSNLCLQRVFLVREKLYHFQTFLWKEMKRKICYKKHGIDLKMIRLFSYIRIGTYKGKGGESIDYRWCGTGY